MGDLGKVDEFYFDDATWIIRYMVVETGATDGEIGHVEDFMTCSPV